MKTDLSKFRAYRDSIDRYVDDEFRKEEQLCDPSDERKLAELSFRRWKFEDMKKRLASAIDKIEAEPNRYLTCEMINAHFNWQPDSEGVILDPYWLVTTKTDLPDRYKSCQVVTNDLWTKALKPLRDLAEVEQDRDNWKALAHAALQAAQRAGADMSQLRKEFGPMMPAIFGADENPF